MTKKIQKKRNSTILAVNAMKKLFAPVTPRTLAEIRAMGQVLVRCR